MSLGFTTTLAPPLPSFSATVQSANTQPQVKVSDVRPSLPDASVPLQPPFPPYPPHPLLFGNHLPVPENMAHPPIPNPANFQMNGDNPLMSTMENWENWRQFQQAAWAHNLDPHMLAFYHNAGYSMEFANGPRRKNATRETTSMLKAWLNEHKKNPYPTKGEKIMLAIITKMSLTQVSTWFANARRRLKKENKMTWSPRNRADDAEGAAPASPRSDDDEEAAPGLEPPIDIDEVSADEEEDGTDAPDAEGADGGAPQPPASPDEAARPAKPKIWSLVDLARKDPGAEAARTPSPLPGPHLGPPGPGCLGALPPPPGAFPGAHLLPPGGLFHPGAPGKFLPPPAAYLGHPLLYPHYPALGLHPFSAFSRPIGPLDAREPPRLTPECLLEREADRPDPSQFNTSKP